jgi:hypothetical protein
MDWPTFSVEIVKALVELVKAVAWPVALVVVAFLFKDKLAGLIDRMKNFDGLGVKASFSEEVKKVEAEVEQLKAEATLNPEDDPMPQPMDVEPPPDPLYPMPDSTIDLDKPIVNYLLLTLHPEAGFQLGRSYLERALVDQFYKMTGTVPGLLLDMDGVIDRLEQKRYITAKIRRTIKELLSLGNQAIHGQFVLSPESAKSYVNAVQSTVDLMKERSKHMPSRLASS